VLCEGEKDADAINALELEDAWSHTIVGTTSGGAGTWNDDLQDKRVVVMPHDDADGEAYAKQVCGSLRTRQIEHCVIRVGKPGVNDVHDWVAAQKDKGTARSTLMGLFGDWAESEDVTPFVLP
jgi:hypothetical protein